MKTHSRLRHLLVLVFWVACLAGHAQESTWSIRESFGSTHTVAGAVYATDTSFYVTGLLTDNGDFVKNGIFFAEYDWTGQLLSNYAHYDSTLSIEKWFNGLYNVDEGAWIMNGMVVDSITQNAAIIRLNSIEEEVNVCYFHNHLDVESKTLVAKSMLQTTAANYLYSGASNTAGRESLNVIKISGDCEKEWQIGMGSSAWHTRAGDMVYWNDQIVLSSWRLEPYQAGELFDAQTQLIAIDTNGQELWTWRSESVTQGISEAMLVTEDQHLLLACTRGEHVVNGWTVTLPWNRVAFTKLDGNRDVVWDTELWLPFHLDDKPKVNDIIPSTDGEGYIAAGIITKIFPGEEYSGTQIGWLAKISHTGDSLWAREIYNHPFSDTSYFIHEVFDLAVAPDGGYLMAGQTIKNGIGWYRQQAWLAKVDEYGCLVPGCHLIDPVADQEVARINWKLFPNPVQEDLRVYVSPASGSGRLRLVLSNMTGQPLDSWDIPRRAATHVFPLTGLPPGMYVLQAVDEQGRLLGTAQIVKQ